MPAQSSLALQAPFPPSAPKWHLGTAYRIVADIRVKSVIVGPIPDGLDASVRQQNVILALGDAVLLLILRVSKVISRVEIPDTIAERVPRLLLLLLLIASNEKGKLAK